MALVIGKLLRKEKSSLLKEPLILHQLKKLSFIHYIGFCRKILNLLDDNVKDYLENYWAENQRKMERRWKDQKQDSGILKMYRCKP